MLGFGELPINYSTVALIALFQLMVVPVLLARTLQEKIILQTIFKMSYLNVGCLTIKEVMIYRLNISKETFC